MKKNQRNRIIAAALCASVMSLGSLVSCGNDKKAPETPTPTPPVVDVVKYSFEITNDTAKGTVKVFDLNNFEIKEAAENDEIVIKVDATDPAYEIDQVTINGTAVAYDEAAGGFKYKVTKENVKITVTYKEKIFKNSLSILKDAGVTAVKVFVNYSETPLEVKDNYVLKVGDIISLKVELVDKSFIKEIKLSKGALTKNDETGYYEFKMTNDSLEFSVSTFKGVNINYSYSGNINLKYVDGENLVSELPEALETGKEAVFKGTVAEGYLLDIYESSVIDDEHRVKLEEDKAKIETFGQNFTITIFNVQEINLRINLFEKIPGKFEHEVFTGKWVSTDCTDSHAEPIVVIDSYGYGSVTTFSNSPTNEIVNKGMLDKQENGLLTGLFKDGTKEYNTMFMPLYDKTNKIYGMLGSSTRLSPLIFSLVKDPSIDQIKQKIYYFKDKSQHLIHIDHNNGTNNKWIYLNGSAIKEVNVFAEDKVTPVNEIIENEIYFYQIDENFIEFKFIDTRIISSSIDKGTYKCDAKDDLVLDGYGNYTLGAEKGTYTYLTKQKAVKLLSDTGELKKLNIDIKAKRYSEYIPQENELTGAIFEFYTRDTNASTSTKITMKFLDDSTVHVTSYLQVDADCIYELDAENNVKFYVPLVCNDGKDRIIKGKFNELFSKITFTDSTFCHTGDLKNIVAEVTYLDYSFQSVDSSSTDNLVITEIGYTYKDAKNLPYDLYVEDTGEITIRSSEAAYELDLINKTFTKIPGSKTKWFIGKTYVGTFTDSDNSDYNVKYSVRIEFHQQYPDFIKLLMIEKEILSFDPDLQDQNGKLILKNIKYEYNMNNMMLTIPLTKTESIVAYAPEKTQKIVFKNTVTVNDIVYYLTSITLKEEVKTESETTK